MSKPEDGGYVSSYRGYKDADGNPLRWRGECKHIFETLKIEDTDAHASNALNCYEADQMDVYLTISSDGSPTSINIVAQFQYPECTDIADVWYDYRIGAWAFLVFSAAEVAGEINEVIDLKVSGSKFRLVATAVGASTGNSFTITAHAQSTKD